MKKKKWLITGVSSGLGKALSEEVIKKGDYVIATFRNAEQVNAFNDVQKEKAHGILLDITSMEDIESQIAIIEKKIGSIDVLVNNAGVGFAGAIEETSLDEVRQVMEANFFGTLKLTQTVLPIMRAQKKGHIIQISSHAGVKAFAGFGIYNASKFALEGFSEALAQEIKPLGIRVTIVEPGPFRTGFAGDRLMTASQNISAYDDTAGAFRKKLKAVHNRQEGDPRKAARAILQYLKEDNGTLRLPLGNIPLKTIKMKAESLVTDLKENETLAKNAVYQL